MHVLMKQPVWHLLSRVDVAGGSTGWHRYHLVDKFIENWREWWLLGAVRPSRERNRSREPLAGNGNALRRVRRARIMRRLWNGA